MVERHISMRGDIIDFNKLRLQHPEKIALGNANMNAKGDIVGKNGIIIKTQEQIDAEWQARIDEQTHAASAVDIKNTEAVKSAAGSNNTKKPIVEKIVDDSDMSFDPPVQNSRRKMIESDE